MKSTAVFKTKKEPTKPFPKLMVSNFTGIIVLFISPQCGTIVHGNNLGCFEEAFVMDNFENFTGTIELSNED